MAISAISLADLLELEDDPSFASIVEPRTGILAWPAIRLDVLRWLVGGRLYTSTGPVVPGDRKVVTRLPELAIRSITWNIRHPPAPAPVLLVATGAGLLMRRGSMFNRYVDYFAGILGADAWTLESVVDDRWPQRARGNPRLTSLGALRLELAFASRRPSGQHLRVARELVDVVRRRVRTTLAIELERSVADRLEGFAAGRLAAYPYRRSAYYRLFEQITPRLAIVEEASYGYMAVFNSAAREFGIEVAEFQHGLVSRNHDAYNVAPSLGSSEGYRRTQPGVFLGYGTWWLDRFNCPIPERVPIGNPHRTEELRGWRPATRRTRIIVLGDGFETTLYLGFARKIQKLVRSQYEVVFRPHPLERSRIPPGTQVPIDREPNLYVSLASAAAVVGEASTALFEAVGLVDRVLAWDTPKGRFYLDEHPFDTAADAHGVAERMERDVRSASGLERELWADGWPKRFKEFIGGRLAQASPHHPVGNRARKG